MSTRTLLIFAMATGLMAVPALARHGGSGGHGGGGSTPSYRPPAPTTPSSTGTSSSSTSTGNSAGHDRHHHNVRGMYYPGYGYYYPGWYGTGDGTPTSSSTSTDTPPNTPAQNGAGGNLFGNPAPAAVNPKWFNTNNSAAKDATPAVAVDPELVKDAVEANAAHERAKQALKDNPQYLAAVAEKQAADDQAATLAAQGTPNFDELFPIAQRSLAAGKVIAEMERQAMANDPTYRPRSAQGDKAPGNTPVADASK